MIVMNISFLQNFRIKNFIEKNYFFNLFYYIFLINISYTKKSGTNKQPILVVRFVSIVERTDTFIFQLKFFCIRCTHTQTDRCKYRQMDIVLKTLSKCLIKKNHDI